MGAMRLSSIYFYFYRKLEKRSPFKNNPRFLWVFQVRTCRIESVLESYFLMIEYQLVNPELKWCTSYFHRLIWSVDSLLLSTKHLYLKEVRLWNKSEELTRIKAKNCRVICRIYRIKFEIEKRFMKLLRSFYTWPILVFQHLIKPRNSFWTSNSVNE